MKKLLLAIATAMLFVSSAAVAEEYVYIVKNDISSWPNKLAKIDGETMTVVDELDVYMDFYSIALNRNGTRLWGSCKNTNYVVVVDTRSFEVLTSISLGDIILKKPAGIACTSDHLAYVAFSETGEVGIYNADTGAYVDTVDVGGTPMRIFVSPDESVAYLVNYQSPPKVTVLRLSDNTVLENIEFTGTSVQEGVFSPDGSTFYLANMNQRQIERIRTSDHTALSPLPIPVDQLYPRSLGITPDGTYLFVGHYTGVDSMVNMWRISDWTQVDSAPIPVNARFIAVRRDGRRIYVSEHSEDKCYAYDVSGPTLSYRDHVSPGAGFVAMNLVIKETTLSPAPLVPLLLATD